MGDNKTKHIKSLTYHKGISGRGFTKNDNRKPSGVDIDSISGISRNGRLVFPNLQATPIIKTLTNIQNNCQKQNGINNDRKREGYFLTQFAPPHFNG